MRSSLLAVLLAGAFVFPAFAQNGPPSGYDGGQPPGDQGGPPPGYQGGPPPAYQGGPQGAQGQPGPHVSKLRQKFDSANVTHDGRLTRAQAETAGLHGVTRHFDDIDTGHKGFITFEELKAYHRATHKAHSQTQPPPAPGQP